MQSVNRCSSDELHKSILEPQTFAALNLIRGSVKRGSVTHLTMHISNQPKPNTQFSDTSKHDFSVANALRNTNTCVSNYFNRKTNHLENGDDDNVNFSGNGVDQNTETLPLIQDKMIVTWIYT